MTEEQLEESKRRKFVRRQLKNIFGRKCAICEIVLTKKTETLDHIVPVAYGGETTVENCQLTCSDCNQRRGKIQREQPLKLEW